MDASQPFIRVPCCRSGIAVKWVRTGSAVGESKLSDSPQSGLREVLAVLRPCDWNLSWSRGFRSMVGCLLGRLTVPFSQAKLRDEDVACLERGLQLCPLTTGAENACTCPFFLLPSFLVLNYFFPVCSAHYVNDRCRKMRWFFVYKIFLFTSNDNNNKNPACINDVQYNVFISVHTGKWPKHFS